MSASYEERQAEWVKKNNIKIGDHVRLIRAASSGEDGWPNGWPDKATRWVGKMLEVQGFNEGNIRCLNLEEKDWFGFPYFVLEKVKHEEKEMKKSYEERQDEWASKNNIEVGDTVRVIRSATHGEDGWMAEWAWEMDDIVGEEGVVKGFIGNAGVRVRFNKKFSWNLPYFVLEKVVESKDKEWTVSYGLKVKTGDPVLMRDDVTSIWWYSIFSHKHSGEGDPFPYCSAGTVSMFCIPYKGNEHLVGTTDDYKSPEKPTKHKFVFGAKVKVKLSNGEETEGVLTGYDFLDDDAPFEVVVRDKEDVLGRVLYWAKEITYID